MLLAEVFIYYNYWSSSKPIVFCLQLYHRMSPPFIMNKQFVTFNDVFIQGNCYISYCFHEYKMTCTCEKCNQKRVIDCLFVISYCFHEYNMTCTCEKCNQKLVIDCLFVKVDVNLHIARQTQLFLTVNSLSSGKMAESSVFQHVNLTWARDPIKNLHLVSGQL